MRWISLVVFLVPVLSLWAIPGQAQQDLPIQKKRLNVQSPILTIDSDRIFNESAFGLRVARDVEVQSSVLAAENRKIEAELEDEERRLTDQRSTLDTTAFRDLADAFDQKVQKTRAAQAAKGRSLSQMVDQERSLFLNAAGPVLEELMQDAGAAVILERLSVFVSANAIDITDEAIKRLDATLGSGKN